MTDERKLLDDAVAYLRQREFVAVACYNAVCQCCLGDGFHADDCRLAAILARHEALPTTTAEAEVARIGGLLATAREALGRLSCLVEDEMIAAATRCIDKALRETGADRE